MGTDFWGDLFSLRRSAGCGQDFQTILFRAPLFDWDEAGDFPIYSFRSLRRRLSDKADGRCQSAYPGLPISGTCRDCSSSPNQPFFSMVTPFSTRGPQPLIPSATRLIIKILSFIPAIISKAYRCANLFFIWRISICKESQFSFSHNMNPRTLDQKLIRSAGSFHTGMNTRVECIWPGGERDKLRTLL